MTPFTPRTDCAAYGTSKKTGNLRCQYLKEMLCVTKGKCPFYNPTYPTGKQVSSKRKRREKRYTDKAAFELWQQGKNDVEIAAAFGVSRQNIQKWRDTLELPSTVSHYVDTKKYRLIETKYGTYAVSDEAGKDSKFR